MAGLPLFPLTLVLFPGALAPLHIFEPRYRRLVSDAAEGDHRFVVLPPGPDGGKPEPGTIGTVARIRAIQPLSDGRSNLVVSGEERVSLVAILAADAPYLLGETTGLPDRVDAAAPSPTDSLAVRQLGERYAAAQSAMSEGQEPAELSNEPGQLSFQVAALLEWDFETQRAFLAVRSDRERVAQLLEVMPALVEDLEARAGIHVRARRNGHGAHP